MLGFRFNSQYSSIADVFSVNRLYLSPAVPPWNKSLYREFIFWKQNGSKAAVSAQ